MTCLKRNQEYDPNHNSLTPKKKKRNLTKEVQVLYNEKHKTLNKKIEDDTRKCEDAIHGL
jgi:hypothetical protein